jgi:anti-anti-sigma factor
MRRCCATYNRTVALSISTHSGDDGQRIALAGEVDLGSVDSLRDAIARLVKSGTADTVLVDLDRVSFLDSTGIAALVEGHRLADENDVTFRVVNPQGMVRRVLEMTDVLEYLSGS